MRIEDIIVGSKKRRNRNSRLQRLVQPDNLYTPNPKKLSEAARIQHVEDLILWDGSEGAKRSLMTLRKMESSPGDATIKWDGSPAVIFGRNEAGEFILTDKSGFSASTYNGRVTSADQLADMFLNRKMKPDATPKDIQNKRDFAGRMRNVWSEFENATPSNYRGFVHGDLLYFDTPKEEKGRLVFAPNTTKYSVDPNSRIGQQIANSSAGVVLHAYIDLDGNTGKVDATKFVGGGLLVVPPVVVTHPAQIDAAGLDQLESFVSSNAGQIDAMFDVPADLQMKNFSNMIYDYINNQTKAGTLDGLGGNFIQWVEGNAKISDKKKGRLLEYIQQHEKAFLAVFKIISDIMKVKNDIIDQLDQQPADITATTDGRAGGEGYVVGGDVKLVNRKNFSQANMARTR